MTDPLQRFLIFGLNFLRLFTQAPSTRVLGSNSETMRRIVKDYLFWGAEIFDVLLISW
jgi:hypothetical protein